MDGFPSGQRGQTVNLLRLASVVRIHLHPLLFLQYGCIFPEIVYNNRVRISAGWSSLEAHRAHNPKVAGSNPAPAIFLCNEKCTDKNIEVKNMLACFLTDIFLDVYGECRKRKTAGLELSTSD